MLWTAKTVKQGSQTMSNFCGLRGNTTIEFRPSFSLHHRPKRCSCPTAATMWVPSGAMARALTKPTTGMELISFRVRKLLAHCHNRMNPSCEPESQRNIFNNKQNMKHICMVTRMRLNGQYRNLTFSIVNETWACKLIKHKWHHHHSYLYISKYLTDHSP